MSASLLIEIGCEEIPARMIADAAKELRARVVAILDGAGLGHGDARAWGGARRIAVRVSDVAESQSAREEDVLGPPAAAAFGADGSPTPAAVGFARKHGIEPSRLLRVKTDRGVYVGFRRDVPGRDLAAVLADALPTAVASMPFPKTMRWGEGIWRWVRPVHWVVVLHGVEVLPIEVLGVRAGRTSEGHRFLSEGPVVVADAEAYEDALRAACVVVDPVERSERLLSLLESGAEASGGTLVDDSALLDEVANLVEWPGVVTGNFDPVYLELPAEILVATLRHHQKAFSVRGREGLRPVFLSVANTDRDPGGHIRRGNEWVVSGRLEDARFFWRSDRERPLAFRVEALARVTFHASLGSYRDKAEQISEIAARLAERVGLEDGERRIAAEGARLAKADLVTGLVGEFPELQGVVGGLLLQSEGSDPALSRAVYEHYRPSGAEDGLPESLLGSVVSVADKLHTAVVLLKAGEEPKGSRDPFGVRRAVNGVFRIALERRWPLALDDLTILAGGDAAFASFLRDRLENFLRDRGSTANEVKCVLSAGDGAASSWPLHGIVSRLEAIEAIRGRTDFAHLVDLTKRVANIRRKNPALVKASDACGVPVGDDPDPEAIALRRALDELEPAVMGHAEAGAWPRVVDELARLVVPVDAFFDKVLVINPNDDPATRRRLRLLGRLESFLTRHYDLRELPGEADRRT